MAATGNADYSVLIDLLLRGDDVLQKLRRDLNSLASAGRKVGESLSLDGATTRRLDQVAATTQNTAKGLDKIKAAADATTRSLGQTAKAGEDFTESLPDLERKQREALAYAAAVARLAVAQGQSARAVDTLQTALNNASNRTVQYLNVQRQLVGVQAQLTTAASKSESAIVREAQAIARLKQISGDTQGAIKTLEEALKKVNPKSLAALRGELQLTYLKTNYANSPLISSIRDINKGFNAVLPVVRSFGPALGTIGNFADQAGNAINGLGGVSAGTAVAVGGLTLGLLAVTTVVGLVASGVRAAASALLDFAQAGIEANKETQTLTIGIASVLAGLAEIRKGGKDTLPLEGAEKFTAALALAADQVAKIRQEATALGLPVQETVEGFQTAVGPLLRMGLTLDQARQTTIKITQAQTALGIPLREIGQETRAILQGDTSRNARLNQILRITKEELAAAKERGDIQELLNKRLEGFAQGGKEFARSYEGGLQRIAALFKNFQRDTTSGLFNSLSESINKALDDVQKIGADNLFGGIRNTLTDLFNEAGVRVSQLIELTIQGVASIDAFLNQNLETIDRIILGTTELLYQGGRFTAEIFRWFGGSKEVLGSVNIIARILQGINLLLIAVTGTIGLIRTGALAAGKGIAVAILKPLAAAAVQIANLFRGVPFLGASAQALADSLTAAASRASTNFQDSLTDFRDVSVSIVKETQSVIKGFDKASEEFTRRREANIKRLKTSIEGLSASGTPLVTDDKKKKKKKTAEPVDPKPDVIDNAEIAARREVAQNQIAIARLQAQEETRLLEAQLADRQISLAAFYREKARLIQDDTDRQKQALLQQLTDERGRLDELTAIEDAARAKRDGSNDARKRAQAERDLNAAIADRIRQEARVADVEGKLTETQIRNSAELAKNERDRILALRQLNDELDEVNVRLLEATGRGFEAASEGIANRFKDLLARAIAEFGEDSAQVLAIKNLQAALLNEATLREFQRQGQVVQIDLDTERARIQNDLLRGVINERQARQEILAIERQRKDVMARQLQDQLELATKIFGANSPEVADIKRAQVELEKLGVDGETAFNRLNKAIEDGFVDALDSIFTRTKSIGEAFTDLLKKGLSVLSRLAAEEITDFIFKRQPRNADGQTEQSGLKGLFDKLFGRNKTEQKAVESAVKKVDSNTTPRLDEIINLLRQNNRSQEQQASELSLLRTGSGGSILGDLFKNVSSGLISGLFKGDGGNGGGQGDLTIRDSEGNVLDGPNTRDDGFIAKIKGVFDSLPTKLSSVFGNVIGGFKNIFGGLVGGASGLLKGAGGFLKSAVGFIGSLFGAGFDSGGFTGYKPRKEAAGIVHGQEFVVRAPMASRYRGILEQMNSGLYIPGYMEGGFVGATIINQGPTTAPKQSAGSAAERITMINVNSEEQALRALASSGGDRVIWNFMSRNKDGLRQILS